MTKSYVSIANAPINIDIPVEQFTIGNKPKAYIKHHKPIGSKDKNHWKRKVAKNQDGQIEDRELQKS